MFLQNLSNKEIIKKYGFSFKNCGDSSVQIALLTKKIDYLQKHFSIHKEDHCGRRGLLKMVARRRRLLNYIKIKNSKKYLYLIKELGLRY